MCLSNKFDLIRHKYVFSVSWWYKNKNFPEGASLDIFIYVNLEKQSGFGQNLAHSNANESTFCVNPLGSVHFWLTVTMEKLSLSLFSNPQSGQSQ